MYILWQTGTKAKRQQLQPGQNFRGSTLSEGSSNVGLLRGAAFGIQQEFMQFKNSLLEGKANISDAKQKRKRYKNNSHNGFMYKLTSSKSSYILRRPQNFTKFWGLLIIYEL